MTAKESKAVARFDLDSSYESRHGVRMYECADGDYVLYDDHQSALHAAEAELGELRRRVGELSRELRMVWNLPHHTRNSATDRIANELRLLASDGVADGDNEGEGK